MTKGQQDTSMTIHANQREITEIPQKAYYIDASDEQQSITRQLKYYLK